MWVPRCRASEPGGAGLPLPPDPANVSSPHTLAERTSALEAERASMRVRMERLKQMIGRTVAGLAQRIAAWRDPG